MNKTKPTMKDNPVTAKTLTSAIIATIVALILFIPSTHDAQFRKLKIEDQHDLQRHHGEEIGDLIRPRAFPTWKSKHPYESWCNPIRSPGGSGLIHVKNHKAGSTTVSGLALRIARRHSPPGGESCDVMRNHKPGWTYRNHADRSFVFTSVRDPTSRALSQVFFQYVTMNQLRPTDDYIIRKLRQLSGAQKQWAHVRDYFLDEDIRSEYWASYQVSYLSMRDPEQLLFDNIPSLKRLRERHNVLVEQILEDYDFIVVAERMEESLVALMFVLELDVNDVLHVSSKVSGKSYRYDNSTNSCQKLVKAHASPKVAKYLTSKEWYWRTSVDQLLHTVANKCLDKTIESIGQDKFVRARAEYREAMAKAEELCLPSIQWPCSSEGPNLEAAHKDCEAADMGCGKLCLDNMDFRLA